MKIAKVLILLTCIVAVANASHWRYYTAKWCTHSRDVDLTILNAWRASAFCTCGTNCVGSSFVVDSGNWGDGAGYTVTLMVTSEDCTEDWLQGNYMDSHSYSADGSYSIRQASCCRIGSLQNSASGSWDVISVVNVKDGADYVSGAINLLPIEPVDPTVPYTRDLTTLSSFPLGSSNIVYSQAACGATAPIPNLSVTSAGILSWDPSVLNTGLWTACVEATYDFDGSSNQLVVDWIFSSQPGVMNNINPFWEPPSLNDGDIISVDVGDPVSFTMQAADSNAGDTVTITATGIPNGAAVVPTPGNPATWTFNWTPTAADVGFAILSFSAVDQVGGFAPPLTVTIEVGVTGGGGDCDTVDANIGDTTASASSANDCVELCFV